MNTDNAISIITLGQVEYLRTWAAMQAYTAARGLKTEQNNDQTSPRPLQNGRNQLWICEHSAIYTQGLAGKVEHVLNPGGIPVVQTDRGGQVTFHGPGQVVAYPLIDLKAAGYYVKEYVYRVEEAVIRALAHFGVTGHRVRGAPGIYVRLDDPFSHARLNAGRPSPQPSPARGRGSSDLSSPARGRGSSDLSSPARGRGSLDLSSPASGRGSSDLSSPASGRGSSDLSSPASGRGSLDLSSPASGRGSLDLSSPASGMGSEFPPLPLAGEGRGEGSALADFSGLGKIAALGIKVSRHCTYHGVALNVAMDLEPFSRINPCGYTGLQTVDLRTIGVNVGWQEAADVFSQKLVSYLAP